MFLRVSSQLRCGLLMNLKMINYTYSFYKGHFEIWTRPVPYLWAKFDMLTALSLEDSVSASPFYSLFIADI